MTASPKTKNKMDTKILAAKNLLKDFFGGYGTSYAIGIGFTILVLFFVSKMSKFITDIFSLPFQIFRTVQSMLLIAQLVLFAFVAIVLYKISVILSLSAPSPSFVADERGVRNVKEEQVNVEISETPKKEKTAEKNTKEKENNELSEEAQIAAILARLDEYDLTPTRRQKFWYNLKLFFWQHSLDIIVTIALIFAYRIFSDWRAKKHQRNIRYRNSLREKARQARRKKNFWLDPIGTIVNLPYFSVFGASIGEDGEIEIEMEEQGRENVMVPNAPKQKQNKMSKILDFAQKHKKTIFFVIATIITTMITILVVRYLLRKKQTEPNLPGIDISEEEKDMDEQEDANDEYDERQEKEEDRGKEEEENELSLEESEKGNDEDEERKKKEEEALILELSEDMDQQENNQEGEESEDYVSLEPSEEDNLDVLSSKLDDEEAEEESEESNEEGGEQTTSVLTDQEVAEGEEGQKAKKTPIWGILSTLVLVVAIL